MKTKFFFATMLIACASFVVNAQGYKDGIDFYKIGKLDDAKDLLERNLDKAETNKAEAYYYLGEIAFHKGDLALAKSYYDKGIQANPQYPFNYVGNGAVALKNGDTKGGENLFKQAEKYAKKNPKLAIAIANAYYYTDANLYAKQIKKQTDNAFKWNPNDPDYYIFKGDELGYQKEWGQAYGQYELAFQRDPNNIEARVKAANVDFFLNPDRALKGLEQLLTEVPNSALVQRELAEKYYENNNGTKALENYAKYYENPNHFAKDEVRYAQLLMLNKEYDKSIDICNNLIAQNDESSNHFFGYRLKLYNQCEKEDWEGALATSSEFFALPEKFNDYYVPRDYAYYATALDKLGRSDEAVTAFERAMTLFPNDNSIRNQLVNIYNKNKEYEKGARIRQAVIDNGNYTLDDLYNLANAYCRVVENSTDPAVKQDAATRALNAVNELTEKQPDEVGNIYLKARIQAAAEETEFGGAALDTYKKLETAVNANKDLRNATAYYQLCYRYFANYYYKQGQTDTAKEYFKKWLEVDPNNEQLRKYVEGLEQQ